MSIAVRFTPPYANGPKDIPCTDMREAQMLAAWLDGVGATDLDVYIVTFRQHETVLSKTAFK